LLEVTPQNGPVPARFFAKKVNEVLKEKFGASAPRLNRKSVVRYIKRASPAAKGIARGWTLPTLLSHQEHIEIQSKSAVSIMRNQVKPSVVDAMFMLKDTIGSEAIPIQDQLTAIALWNNIGNELLERLTITGQDIQALMAMAKKRARLVFEG